MSSIVGGLDILRQWRFSAVLEHHAAAVRMTLNPAWKVDFIDPEEAQLPLQQAAEARRQASSTVTFNLNNKNNSEKDNNNNAGANQNNNNNNTPATKNGMPKMFLVPFLAFTDETMAPRKGATDLLSGFSVGWGTTIKKVKFFYANLPPPLHLSAVGSADPEELELSRMKAWCKRCVQHVLDDNRVVSIDCEKKLRKLRTKSMLSKEQRISLGGRHNGFRFNIAYEQKGEVSPQSNAIALCVCSKDRGYMVLIECVSQTELEGYMTNVLVKTWLSDSKRFELDADINNYSECSHAALQLQQALFGELVFTDNDAAIAFRLPMHPMTLRPDHSPTVPPATGSLCCVTLDLVIHQKLLDALEEDEAMAVGGKMRLINVVLFVEIEDLLKEPNFPTVFSGDAYSQRRHQAFTEVFRDSRVIGLPLSVPIGKRTGRSTTCTFSTVMNDTQALVKATTVTTLVGSHGAAATYFTKLGQGMFDQYLYLYQHLLKTLTFFAERDISGTFSRYRSVPVRILEPDLAACYPHHNGVDPSARLLALQKHITALRASSDGEVDGVGTSQMADVIRIDENMTNPATGSASAKLASHQNHNNNNKKQQQQNNNNTSVEDEGVIVIVSEDGVTTTTAIDNNDNNRRKKNADGSSFSPHHEASDASNNSEDNQHNNNNNNNNQYYYGFSSRRFTDNDSVISITDIPRLASEELALLEEEEEQRLLKEKMLLAGEVGDSNLISGSPGGNNNNNRARSPGMMAGDDEELNTNNNQGEATGGGGGGHLLDVNTNTKIGGGGGGADSVREGNSDIQIESRLSSYNKQQGAAGAGGSHLGHDRSATGSVGVAIDEEDENASIVPSIADSNTNRANDQESSRMATAGGSQIAGAGVDTDSMDPDRHQQRGQPTQQQLQDLSEALALIGDHHHHQKNSRSGNQGAKNDVEDEIEAVMNSTGGGGQKQQPNQQQTGGTSSLRNSYAELCKEAGCRPNSYLLQKLPVLPRIAQTIEALDMSHNYVGHSGFIAILRLLDLLPRLHSVYFNSMSLDNQDVISLCDTLAEHTTIHSVFLKNNPRITLPAAKSFFRLLKDNINIHTICLTGTGIGIALQQRIEKEATLNKEIQTQNEKMRKQQQQAAVAGTNINTNNNDNEGSPSSPLKMTTLTVGAPGSQPHLDEEYNNNNQQQQQRVQNSASSPSVASGTTNNSSPKPQNHTEEL